MKLTSALTLLFLVFFVDIFCESSFPLIKNPNFRPYFSQQILPAWLKQSKVSKWSIEVQHQPTELSKFFISEWGIIGLGSPLRTTCLVMLMDRRLIYVQKNIELSPGTYHLTAIMAISILPLYSVRTVTIKAKLCEQNLSAEIPRNLPVSSTVSFGRIHLHRQTNLCSLMIFETISYRGVTIFMSAVTLTYEKTEVKMRRTGSFKQMIEKRVSRAKSFSGFSQLGRRI